MCKIKEVYQCFGLHKIVHMKYRPITTTHSEFGGGAELKVSVSQTRTQ